MSPIKAVAPDVITIKHIDLSAPNRLCPALREQIVSGRGLKVVIQQGWHTFRNSLLAISYSEIFRQQTAEIEALQKLSLLPKPISQEKIKTAEVRADQLAIKLQSQYPKEGKVPFYASAESDKYWVLGKQRGKELPLTRIYIGQRIDNAPETFDRLIKELEIRGCLAFIDIALNREIFFPDGRSIENNAIIIYVMKNNREVLRNVCQAIETAQVDSGLSAAERAQLKEDNIRDFMVPLADNVGFVEMNSYDSYHTTIRQDLFKEIFDRWSPWRDKLSLAEIQEKHDRWSPEDPGFFQGKYQKRIHYGDKPILYPPNLLANRRKYMPALVF